MHTEPPEAGVEEDDRLVVELEGDLDVVSAGPVGDQLCGLVDVGELIIEVDCRAVTFIESRGLAMMARVQRLANESGCRLTWRASAPPRAAHHPSLRSRRVPPDRGVRTRLVG